MSTFILTRREIIFQVFSFLLGVASSSSPTYGYVLIASVIILYSLVIIGLPKVHPGILLDVIQNGITDMRMWLNNEATTRPSYRMFWISARGLQSAACIEQRVNTLLYQNQRDCTIPNALLYIANLPKLVADARKCQSDLASLRVDLEDEIRRINDDAGLIEFNYPIPVAP